MKNLFKTLLVGALCALTATSAVGCTAKQPSSPTKRSITSVTMTDDGVWSIGYANGNTVEMGEVEVDENATTPTLAVQDGKWVVNGVKTDATLAQNERLCQTVKDELVSVAPQAVNGTARYLISGTTIAKNDSENYNSVWLQVHEGERYVTTFAVQSDSVMGVIFTDENDQVLTSNFHKKDKNTLFADVELTVPQGAKNLYINSRNPEVVAIKKVERKAIYRLGQSDVSMKIACYNCGQFDYADTVAPLTSEQYAQNWKDMIAEVNADVFGFEDVVNTNVANSAITDVNGFGPGISPNEVIHCLEGRQLINMRGAATCNRVASRFAPVSVNTIPCDYKIAGSTKETQRFFAMRYTFYIGGKYVAFYTLHLVAESHISADPVGNSLSQQLRQKQFATILEDAKLFDESIFFGDFNAQVGTEYQTFTDHGYSMVNDGSYLTLRNLTADNIVVSGGITIDNFDVLRYTLNTDHLGLAANITFA